MKGASQCAQRFKQLMRKLQKSLGNVSPPAASDPITHALLGILSRDAPEQKARDALERLCASIVDYNEMRVIPPLEMTGALGNFPGARLKCEDISRALNKIFAMHHTVTLENAAPLDRKSLLALLEQIDGLDPYSRARMRLFGFQKHAFPLDSAMLTYARQTQIIDGQCTHDDAQNFLERQTNEGDAPAYFALLRKHAWSELTTAIRRGDIEAISSVPPDRTTRNMLQLIGSGGVIEVERPAGATEPAPEPAPTPPKPSRAKSRRSSSSENRPARSAAEKPKPRAAKPRRKTKKSTARKTKTSRKNASARKTTRRGAARAKSA